MTHVEGFKSLEAFFKPRAVTLIGASRDPHSIGFRLLDELLRAGFQGPVYPVNPRATEVCSLKVYPSVRDIPQPVDLAIIAVPAAAVLATVDDCAACGIRAIIVITAGFSEVGEEGKRVQRQLTEKVRGYGMRMIGPNCMGLLNTDPAVRLNASFSPVFPPAGSLAMSSQSGALGLAILALAAKRELGLSTFVSVGNKADVSSNDLLDYWEGDPATKVILLYLESFGNPRRFARIAPRVGRSKPIVAVKAGRSSAGKRAAGSHTAALASSDTVVDALFRQAGVIRAQTLDEMFDIAATLSSQPLPAGRRVGIVTNAGGPGILCADACDAQGLSVPEFSEETKKILREFLPPAASVLNPIDMVASAGPESYRQAIETVLKSSEVDALVIIFIPLERGGSSSVSAAIRDGILQGRLNGGAGKTVVACVMSDGIPQSALILKEETIPTYAFPETAARVLSKCVEYSEWKSTGPGLVPAHQDIRLADAHETIVRFRQTSPEGWLPTELAEDLLTTFGFRFPARGFAKDPSEAAVVAQRIGFPVALKLASSRILHKSDVGGVQLNLKDRSEVERAFHRIRSALAERNSLDAMDGVIVQQMVSGGVEVMAGVTSDPLFGSLIAFGLGGIHVEILGDVLFRMAPLTDKDARSLIRGIRGFRLLEGYRGHPPADLNALEDVLLRVSRLVEEIPEIAELDLNPILAMPPGEGCYVLDARIRLGR